MPFSVGDNLGPYELLAPIGSGGMGDVWKAQDTRLGRTVAIKILRAAHGERFQREARAIAALNHPHVCTLHDIGPNYLVMEYVEGKPLSGPLRPEKARQLAVEIAQALTAAHARGIVHRDLKPANILVTEGGVKLLDFGLATAMQEDGRESETITQTQAGVIVGTASYMSPEQAEGKPADARSDVFSFGLVLYEMLSGRRAFTGDTFIGVAAAILHKDPEPLRGPADLVAVVDRCLRKDPAERYQSMAEVAAALTAARPQLDSQSETSGRWRAAPFRRYAAALGLVAVIAAGAVYRSTSRVQTIDSIAVLPFANTGGNPETEYLSDGITDAVINSLAAASRLKVIARTTVFMLKDQGLEPQKAGHRLGVGAVLTGKVSCHGDSINIQADLVKVADGSELWGTSFRQRLADMQNLQGEIAREIAEKLRLRLEGDEQRRLTRRFTDNGEAFQLYLKALHTPWGRSRGDATQRLDLLGQAVAKDPGFARAYVAMADTYFRLGESRWWPVDKALAMQKDAVQKALALDNTLGEAHLQLARSSLLEFDLAEAEREFQRALELNTNAAHVAYGRFLAQLGRKQEAIAEAQRGLEVDPLDRMTQIQVTSIHWLAGMNDQAVEEFKKMFGDQSPCFICADILVQRGQYREAIAEWEKMAADNAGTAGHRAQAYVKAGRIADGRRILADLESRARREKIGAYEAAFIHAALGETDEAFHWLDTAYDQRDPGLLYLKTDRLLDPLRSDARFDRLLRRIGLPL